MDWLETKFLTMVSNRLRNFKRKSSSLYNFSCNFCGDSKTDSSKARAFIYTKKGTTLFHCHNCGKSTNFNRFLEEFDVQLHTQFVIEKLKDRNAVKDQEQKQWDELKAFTDKLRTPVYRKEGPLKGLKKVSQLHHDHPIKAYVEHRLIPTPYHAKLFYCPKFFAWVNELIPGKFSKDALNHDHGRLVIPFLTKEGQMHAFQGRDIDSSDRMRYITLVLDESVPKVYGLDQVDFNKKTYVTEGPFDAMFLPNSIATAGGDLVSSIRDFPKNNIVVIYDNEPRSKETKKKLEKAIINGYKVCIWPEKLEYKDINEMVQQGLSADFVKYIIDQNTHKDLAARMALTKWSKV